MLTYSRTSWRRYFEDSGLGDAKIELYMQYVNHFYDMNVPPIFEFRHLAALLGRTAQYLSSVICCPEKHYRQFKIPKRNGGDRVINAPYPALLESQRWINNNILLGQKTHRVVHGFKRKKSIITNAKQHLGRRVLLKMDLKEFFPSISIHRVIALFQYLGYPNNVAYYLSRLCCHNGSLSQGAATSPYISNLIARKMDTRFYKLCKQANLRYTRYADDLTFSGEVISKNIRRLIEDIIVDEGFCVNKKKTRFCPRKGRRIITGISVSGDVPRVPREIKRSLRQEVHYILKHGVKSHMGRIKIRHPYYIQSLYGKLLFWKWVEPWNSFLEKKLPSIEAMLPQISFANNQDSE